MSQTLIYKTISILFLSYLCCTDIKETQIFHIDPTGTDVGLFSDYFIGIKYVNLELDPDNPIGNIKQLICTNNSYFILDNITNKVFNYDFDGKIKFVINKRGNGPGEYNKISCISINDTDSLLIILDNMGKAIRYYSTTDGSFQKDMHLNNLPNSITYIGEGKIAEFMNFYLRHEDSKNKLPYNLLYFKKPDKIINHFLPYNPEDKYPSYSSKMFTQKDGVTYFMPPFYNEVYFLDANNCTQKLQMDFGRYNFKGDIFDGANNSSEKFDKLYKSDMVYDKSDFYEFQSYYNFSFSWKGDRKIAFLNKNDQKVKVYKRLKNDINGFPAGFFITSTGNQMYYVVEPYDIIGRRNYFYNKSMDPSVSKKEQNASKRYYFRVDSVFGQISETDNPIIAIYNLK